MKIIMTGATGYIGSAVADALVQGHHHLIAVAHSLGDQHRLQERGIEVIAGDIAAPKELATLIADSNPDAVVWVATSNLAEVDAAAVVAILERLEDTGAAFLYTSGAWVHGETGNTVIEEDAVLHPVELVAWRVAVERRVLETRGVRGIVIRPGIVYGRGGGIPSMMTVSARTDGAAKFVGTGRNRWPLVYLDDLADLYRRAIEGAPPGTVLLGVAPTSFTVAEIATAASEGSGGGGRTTAWPLVDARRELGTFADALVLDQPHLSGRRARQMLGWIPHGPTILDELRTGSYAIASRGSATK